MPSTVRSSRSKEGGERRGRKHEFVFERLQYVKHSNKLLKITVFCNLHVSSVGKTGLCSLFTMKVQSLNERNKANFWQLHRDFNPGLSGPKAQLNSSSTLLAPRDAEINST